MIVVLFVLGMCIKPMYPNRPSMHAMHVLLMLTNKPRGTAISPGIPIRTKPNAQPNSKVPIRPNVFTGKMSAMAMNEEAQITFRNEHLMLNMRI
jgi:hypothetical protein